MVFLRNRHFPLVGYTETQTGTGLRRHYYMRSIGIRSGPAFLQFDWSQAGLGMDLPVFVYSYTKTSFKFLSRQGKYRSVFYVATDLLLQTTQREPYRAHALSRFKSFKVY